MDQTQQELDRELIGHLTRKAQAKERTHLRACWVDGSECPYGQPGGQFLKRPRQFCRPSRGRQKSGCLIMDSNLGDLNVVTKELQQKETERALSAIMEEQALSLSGEVGAAANSEGDEEKKKALGLAVAIIREREKAKDMYIVKIFRGDDLADAIEKELEIKIKYKIK